MGGTTRGLMSPIRRKSAAAGAWGKAPWHDFTPQARAQNPAPPWSAFVQRSSCSTAPHVHRKADLDRPENKQGCTCGSGTTCEGCQGKVQRQATMSTPGDPDEREADEVAAAVTGTPDLDAADSADDLETPVEPIIDVGDPDPPGASFSEESGSDPTVRARSSGSGRVLERHDSAVDHAAAAVRDGGVPMSARDRRFFEPKFGADFSAVRIHTEGRAASAADAIGAHAFTSGAHIAFAPGQFSPSTAAGRRLIAHELAHVVQQSARPGALAVARKGAKGKAKGQEPPCPKKPDGAAAIIALDVDVGSGTLRMTWSRAKGKGTIETSRQVTIGAGVCGTDCNDPAQSRAGDRRCTPKGDFTIQGKTPHMTHHPDAQWVSWLDMGRGVAIHFLPVPPQPPRLERLRPVGHDRGAPGLLLCGRRHAGPHSRDLAPGAGLLRARQEKPPPGPASQVRRGGTGPDSAAGPAPHLRRAPRLMRLGPAAIALLVASASVEALLPPRRAALAAPPVLKPDPVPGCKAPGGVLPAGLRSGRIGNYEEVVQEILGCPRPGWAVLAEVSATAQAAAAAMARFAAAPASAQLAPGYPWVVQSSELGLAGAGTAPAGVALVVGTFETKPEAEAWMKAHAQLPGPLRLEAFARGGTTVALPSDHPTVVRMQAGTDVPAFSLDAARAQAAARGHRRGRAATPACRIHPDSIFVFHADELFPTGLPARAFSPVRCENGSVAYVPWTSTLNESVVWQSTRGGAHLSQITAVECDSPAEILDWVYGPGGRVAPPHRLSVAGCQ